jgi:hypothetical protein
MCHHSHLTGGLPGCLRGMKALGCADSCEQRCFFLVKQAGILSHPPLAMTCCRLKTCSPSITTPRRQDISGHFRLL